MSIQLGDGTITFGDGSIQKYSATTVPFSHGRLSGITKNTTYTNNRGYPLHVHIMGQGGYDGDDVGYVDDVPVLRCRSTTWGSSWASFGSSSFIVPNGSTYKLEAAGPTLNISVQY